MAEKIRSLVRAAHESKKNKSTSDSQPEKPKAEDIAKFTDSVKRNSHDYQSFLSQNISQPVSTEMLLTDVFYCDKKRGCKWKCFMLEANGYSLGKIPNASDAWVEWHEQKCGGKLIQAKIIDDYQLTKYQKSEDAIRLQMFLSHSCQGKYGDDGEMQCNRLIAPIDFKRDSIKDIVLKSEEHIRADEAKKYDFTFHRARIHELEEQAQRLLKQIDMFESQLADQQSEQSIRESVCKEIINDIDYCRTLDELKIKLNQKLKSCQMPKQESNNE